MSFTEFYSACVVVFYFVMTSEMTESMPQNYYLLALITYRARVFSFHFIIKLSLFE